MVEARQQIHTQAHMGFSNLLPFLQGQKPSILNCQSSSTEPSRDTYCTCSLHQFKLHLTYGSTQHSSVPSRINQLLHGSHTVVFRKFVWMAIAVIWVHLLLVMSHCIGIFHQTNRVCLASDPLPQPSNEQNYWLHGQLKCMTFLEIHVNLGIFPTEQPLKSLPVANTDRLAEVPGILKQHLSGHFQAKQCPCLVWPTNAAQICSFVVYFCPSGRNQ